MKIAIRHARADDEGFVLSLAGRFAETRPVWRTESEVTEGTVAELRRAFAQPDDGSAILIAEYAAGKPLGFAYLVLHVDFFTGEKHGHVSEIAVAHDGNGVGRPLMEAANAYFRSVGVRFVTLNVNIANERAQRFYESLGYATQLRQLVKVLSSP